MAQPTQYSSWQIRLHWIIAVLVILLLSVLAETIEDGWKLLEKSGVRNYSLGVWLHLGPGILVLALTLWRGVLRLVRGVPALPENEHPLAKKLAHLTHLTLYGLLIVVSVSGLLAWYGASGMAAGLHNVTQALMIFVIVLHTLAALVHHFILRTDVMRRMLRRGAD